MLKCYLTLITRQREQNIHHRQHSNLTTFKHFNKNHLKLQFKLALYNTLTKLAIIIFTGLLILFSLENITYNHISSRLEGKEKWIDEPSLWKGNQARCLISSKVLRNYKIF